MVMQLAVKFRPVEALVPYARNSRKHSDAQVAQLAASMVEFGVTNPVLADAQGIVAGHGRIMAARKLYAAGRRLALPDGTEIPEGTYPVLDVTGWPETKRRAYVIADNKLALNATWDEEVLKLELHALAEADYQLDLTGFTGDDLSQAMFDDPPKDDDGTDGDGDVNFSIQYNLVFDTEAQQSRWFNFLKELKAQFPEEVTAAARLDKFLEGQGLGEA